MDAEAYIGGIQSAANQPLGGKEMRFPIGGLSSVVGASHLGGACTVASLNVVLRSPYNVNATGGTRPGLKAFTGTQPSSSSTSIWLWPNGDVILWPDGDRVAFGELGSKIIMPDGSVLFNPHETFMVSASVGSVPPDCTSIALYRDRIVAAKDSMWYASRIGSHNDFDYGADADDISKAVAGNAALAGRQGESITVLAPVMDAAMIVATKRSLWRFSGEVTNGLSCVSETIGIISRHAWCFDGNRFWFIGPNGLYSMVIGESPVHATAHLTDKMSGWSSATLVYDAERKGIHIFGQLSDNSSSDWFFDITNSGAFPMSYPVSKRPISGGLAMLDNKNRIVFLCADGVFRYWDENQDTDDGTQIVSAVALGPLTHTTGDTENAFLAELDCEMDSNVTTSYGVNLSVVIGNTSNAATAFAKDIVAWISNGATGTFSGEKYRKGETAGWNHVVRPRIRCNSFSVILWSLSNRWAMSNVTAVHRGCGRIRR